MLSESLQVGEMLLLEFLHRLDCCLFVVFHVVVPLGWEVNELKSLLVLKLSLVILMYKLHQTLDPRDFCSSEVADLLASFLCLCELALTYAVLLEVVQDLDETNDFLVWQEIDSSAFKVLISRVLSQRHLTFLCWRILSEPDCVFEFDALVGNKEICVFQVFVVASALGWKIFRVAFILSSWDYFLFDFRGWMLLEARGKFFIPGDKRRFSYFLMVIYKYIVRLNNFWLEFFLCFALLYWASLRRPFFNRLCFFLLMNHFHRLPHRRRSRIKVLLQLFHDLNKHVEVGSARFHLQFWPDQMKLTCVSA